MIPSQKLIIQAIADHPTRRCSLNYLADTCELSRTALKVNLQQLRAWGYVIPERDRLGRGAIYTYKLHKNAELYIRD